MHVRVSRVRRKGKTYEYPQLVESYRRAKDGLPVHRVIAALSDLSPIELDNLRTALAASRKGKKVVVASALSRGEHRRTKPAANLRYLDIAVMLEMWRQWKLDKLFDELLPIGEAVVAPWAIVASLVIQRCVDAGSKAYAERWFPRTALPELLGVAPAHFHNTRVHRILDALDDCGCDLMAKLPRSYAKRDGAFAALFIDVTDTWFVGRGPKMAEQAKTKEGLVRRKVGIVLLCNDQGLPLRWEVIPGKQGDKESMDRMARSIGGLSWVGDTPVVCDRAMGNTAQIRQLLSTELRFVTALVRTEFGSYTDAIPHQPFASLVPPAENDPEGHKRCIAQAAELAEQAGMDKVAPTLYVLDLGVVERPADTTQRVAQHPDGARDDATMQAMELGRQIRTAVAQGRANSLAAAGRALGLGRGVTKKYRYLANLSEDIQLAVLKGKARGVSIGQLLGLRKQPDVEAQQRAFKQLRQQAAARGGKPRRSVPARPASSQESANVQDKGAVRVRAVAYFNPQMFVDQRLIAHKRLADIDAFVDALNRRLSNPRSKLTKAKALVAVHQKLSRHDLIDAYKTIVIRHRGDGGVPSRYSVRLTLNEHDWARRRRYDGFSLLVTHPKMQMPAAELCALYRAKDVVEKDFETIKSLVKLRPVRHRVNAKVRAHVTICMLALLLERTLQRRLGSRHTAERALEELSTCYLNRYSESDENSAYALTQLNEKQNAILRALRLRHLANDEEIADQITPR